MDKNKRLEQFFKNRLNEFNSSGEDWDLPDASVFQNAQAHFPKHPKKEKKNRKMIFIFFAVGLLSYIFYLKKNVHDIKAELNIAHTYAEQLNNKLTDLEKRTFEEEYDKENNNNITIQKPKNIKENFTKTTSKSNFAPKFSIKNNLVENNNLIKNITHSSSSKELDKNPIIHILNTQVPNFNIIKLNSEEIKDKRRIEFLPYRNFQISKNLSTPFQLLNTSVIHDLIPRRRNNRNFEIGLSYTTVNYETSNEYEFKKLEPTKKDKDDFNFQSNGLQANVAFDIHPNFWITTGIRKTNGSFEKWYFTKLIYDKDGEYINDEGKTVNEFEINSISGFGDSRNQINYELPDGSDIEDGEYLVAKWNHYQKFSFIQIPIGINYMFGKNKLQGFLKGGIGWNKVSFGEYFVEASLEYDNENLTINKNEKDKDLEVSSQFMNGYLGGGVNYQLTRNLYTRTSFSFEKNFNQSKKYLGSNGLAKVFDLGLHYRF